VKIFVAGSVMAVRGLTMEVDDEELRYMSVPGEINLHEYSVGKALETFVSYYNHQVSCRSFGQIKVIHGYGSSGTGA
jgi:hypothetical protein